jgi:hypothetical protein
MFWDSVLWRRDTNAAKREMIHAAPTEIGPTSMRL